MILVDTTPLVALCDPRDGLHERALRDLGRVKGETLAVCEPVMTEACFLLAHPVQRSRLFRMVCELPLQSAPEGSADLWPHVFDWLGKYDEHEPDWADAYLVSLASRVARAKIWTYDAEFWTTWRAPDGKRLPLFVKPSA